MFFEPKILYRSAIEEVPSGDYTLPIGKAEVLLEGIYMSVINKCRHRNVLHANFWITNVNCNNMKSWSNNQGDTFSPKQ